MSPNASQITRFAVAASAAGLGWALLTGAEALSWVIGAPAALAAGVVFAAPRAGAAGLSPWLAIRFAVRLLADVFVAASQVAAMVFRRNMGVAPGFVTHRLTLDAPAARAVFMNAITLTPGTLSARAEGDVLYVHVLREAGVAEDLSALERRVAAVFARETEGAF